VASVREEEEGGTDARIIASLREQAFIFVSQMSLSRSYKAIEIKMGFITHGRMTYPESRQWQRFYLT
jgi:hypothetical protein